MPRNCILVSGDLERRLHSFVEKFDKNNASMLVFFGGFWSLSNYLLSVHAGGNYTDFLPEAVLWWGFEIPIQDWFQVGILILALICAYLSIVFACYILLSVVGEILFDEQPLHLSKPGGSKAVFLQSHRILFLLAVLSFLLVWVFEDSLRVGLGELLFRAVRNSSWYFLLIMLFVELSQGIKLFLRQLLTLIVSFVVLLGLSLGLIESYRLQEKSAYVNNFDYCTAINSVDDNLIRILLDDREKLALEETSDNQREALVKSLQIAGKEKSFVIRERTMVGCSKFFGADSDGTMNERKN